MFDIFPPFCSLIYLLISKFKYSLTSSFDMFACVKGDVYPIEPPDGFTVNQVLDAHWGVLNEEDVSGLSLLIVVKCIPFLVSF